MKLSNGIHLCYCPEYSPLEWKVLSFQDGVFYDEIGQIVDSGYIQKSVEISEVKMLCFW